MEFTLVEDKSQNCCLGRFEPAHSEIDHLRTSHLSFDNEYDAVSDSGDNAGVSEGHQRGTIYYNVPVPAA